MTYLLSEHAGDKEVTSYVDELINVWVKMQTISKVIEGQIARMQLNPAPLPGQVQVPMTPQKQILPPPATGPAQTQAQTQLPSQA